MSKENENWKTHKLTVGKTIKHFTKYRIQTRKQNSSVYDATLQERRERKEVKRERERWREQEK